jgi:hypothetical protein
VPFWWGRLLEDPVFIELLKQRWSALRANVLATQKVVDLVRQTADYLVDNEAIKRNYERWTGIDIVYENEIEGMITYLQNRLSWMDDKISNM